MSSRPGVVEASIEEAEVEERVEDSSLGRLTPKGGAEADSCSTRGRRRDSDGGGMGPAVVII